MLQILTITAPIFVLIGLGFAVARAGFLPKEAIPPLGRFILYLAVPAVLFRALSTNDLFSTVDPLFLVAYGGAAICSFLLAVGYSLFVARDSLGLSALMGLGASLPNTVFVGYPLLSQVFGDAVSPALIMALLVENLLLMPLALFLLEVSQGLGGGRSFGGALKGIGGRMVTNPMMVAITVGGVVSVLAIPVPAVLAKCVDLLAMAGPATALIYIGATLAGTRIEKMPREELRVTLSKLVIHPALAIGAVWLLPPFDPLLQTAVIVLSSAPMLGIFPIMGARYGHGPLCARAQTLCTGLAFLTISLLLWGLDTRPLLG
ncbi:MAG: AEC family transporter [Rhodospirillum sp.]|nr:AEC family transporter [Rhodospirillum sp.]MCF8488565.1 AEC family transporter [Rhodospirillum sp.]MCF8499161.1 AEC family transporter [Rhodospirillum sp.]